MDNAAFYQSIQILRRKPSDKKDYMGFFNRFLADCTDKMAEFKDK